MKENILSVIIKKPLHEVFEFTTHPQNTHKWIDGIVEEQAGEYPPKNGTIYKNRANSALWEMYRVTRYIEDQEFELIKEDSSTYHVNYFYSAISENETQLTYREWVIHGEIKAPFTQSTLNKLKTILESDE